MKFSLVSLALPIKIGISSCSILLATAPLFSQRELEETSGFIIAFEGKATRFTPQMPQLNPIPGAPEPFYTFHWEFGDGNFSTDERPLYQYAKPESHDVYLAATAVYDKGKRPKGKKGKVPGATGLMASASSPPFRYAFEKRGQAVGLKANHDARPEEEIVLILSYQNTATMATDGTFHLFFNEKAFPERHFEFESARLHFGETGRSVANHSGQMANLAAQHAQSGYRDEQVFEFKNLAAGERRNAFFTLLCTPEMVADISTFIHLKAVFVPTAAGLKPEECTLELPIVASHDPNVIAVSDSRVNFRHLKREKLEYKVRFQNNGDGPAKKIELTVEVPNGLDLGRMRPVDWYPRCPICPPGGPKNGCLDTLTTKNGLVFTFRNVYLPGSKQAGLTDRDSTKGFVKYRIDPKKRMDKRPFNSRASIVFDKNPPVLTNFSNTRFKPGLSPGFKAGYEFPPDDPKNGGWFVGASLSPFKSWRVYPQVEILAGRLPETSFNSPLEIDTFHVFNFTDVAQDSVVLFQVNGSSRASWVEVPVLFRKNFTSFFGLGLGASIGLQKNSGQSDVNRTTEILNYHFQQMPGSTAGQLTWDGKKNATTTDSSTPFSNRKTQFSVFADVTIGAVRAGPNLGIRAGGRFVGSDFEPFVQASLEFKF